MNAALLRKELRRYFGSTSLVTNTMVGPVMVALCAVMLAAQKDLMVQIMLESGVDFARLPIRLRCCCWRRVCSAR